MARKQERKFTSFNLENSPVVAENERILNNPTIVSELQVAQPTTDSQQTTTPIQPQQEQTIQNQAPSFVSAAPISKTRPKKSENGITIAVPMEYYERITIMKMRTGIPIRDLALQAVIEFLENHKND